jgi:hypothetical protein
VSVESNILVSAGTLCYLAGRFATCGRLPHSGSVMSAYSQESLTHVISSLRLRKASCLLKRGAVVPGELLKSSWYVFLSGELFFFCAVAVRCRTSEKNDCENKFRNCRPGRGLY